MTEAEPIGGSVAGDDRIRLFCGLRPSDDTVACLAAWQAEHLPPAGGRIVPPEHLHLTLAFLGHRPAAEAVGIAAELRQAAAAMAGPVDLRPLRYRETRSVGMIVYEDAGGAATALAEDLQGRLQRRGVYRREERRWLPHVTVLRFSAAPSSLRRGFREWAGLRLEVPNTCSIHDVRAALYRSLLGRGPGENGGAVYEVLETAALGGTADGS